MFDHLDFQSTASENKWGRGGNPLTAEILLIKKKKKHIVFIECTGLNNYDSSRKF